jgi:hypothetical protein
MYVQWWLAHGYENVQCVDICLHAAAMCQLWPQHWRSYWNVTMIIQYYVCIVITVTWWQYLLMILLCLIINDVLFHYLWRNDDIICIINEAFIIVICNDVIELFCVLASWLIGGILHVYWRVCKIIRRYFPYARPCDDVCVCVWCWNIWWWWLLSVIITPYY